MANKDPYAALRFREFNIFLLLRFVLETRDLRVSGNYLLASFHDFSRGFSSF